MLSSELYNDWYEQVVLPPENDYVICLSASSRTPVSGTGKTTCGGGIAKTLDRSESGFDAETQATLNAGDFANEVIPEAEHGSAVVMDESQGTPGEGSGMNRMRAMSETTLEAIGSVLANRDKNMTIIVIVQQIHMLFSDFYPLVDSWLMITRAPGQIGGPEIKHHKLYTEDYPDSSGGLRTPVVEYLDWPALPEDDPDYRVLERMKQEAKTKRQAEPEDEGLSDEEELRHVRNARRTFENKRGTGPVAWKNIVDVVEREWDIELSYTGEHYRQQLADETADEEDEDEPNAEATDAEPESTSA